MTNEEARCSGAEHSVLTAAIVDARNAEYVAIRAWVALDGDTIERAARMSATSREFVVEMRRRACEHGARAMLAAPLTPPERVLEAACDEIAAGAPIETLRRRVARATGIPERTIYNGYASNALLDAMCRRRAQTVWRARFEQRVLAASDDPARRLLAIVDVLETWMSSPAFARDQALRAAPSFASARGDDDRREHLREIDRFATALGVAAGIGAPQQFGAFIATLIDGTAGWFDRRSATRAASLAVIERFIEPPDPR